MKQPLITILGCTATGKTALAAKVAFSVDGEVISADSRQVYRHMDIGTGKDYSDYIVEGQKVPVHLIDIAEPGEEYNIFRYRYDFNTVYTDITGRGKQAILCGGSGMYLESVLKGYHLPEITNETVTVQELEKMQDDKLLEMLGSLKPLHNKTDTEDRARMIKAIQIAAQPKQETCIESGPIPSFIFGLHFPRGLVKARIAMRLKQRLEQGMIEEVKELINMGITPERLMKYGLEYKFIALYLTGKITLDELSGQLYIAICQFSKRQMTWFRRMERQGFQIHWIDGRLPMEEKMGIILTSIAPSKSV